MVAKKHRRDVCALFSIGAARQTKEDTLWRKTKEVSWCVLSD